MSIHMDKGQGDKKEKLGMAHTFVCPHGVFVETLQKLCEREQSS